MLEIKKEGDSKVSFSVDINVYNNRVITKVLYWISDTYYVYRQSDLNITHIMLEKKEGVISEAEFAYLKRRLNQDLIDYSTRDIVNRETISIRNLLLVKAFSASDEFDEKNIFTDEDLI